MAASDRRRTRPTVPASTGVPSSSTIRISTPGTGAPTVDATSSSDDDSVVPVPSDDSVEVYRTTTGTPKRSRMAATRAEGTRAAPVEATRRELTSTSANSGRANIKAHCVGTPWPTVIRSSPMMRRASAACQGVGVMTVVTPWAISSHARVMYPTWANGTGERRRSPGWLSTSVPRATAARLAWSNTAPLGMPVVPLVQTTATGSCAVRSGHPRGGASYWPDIRSARSITRVRPSGTRSLDSLSSTKRTGAVRSMIEATSPRPIRGLMPDVIAPSRSRAA